MIDNREIDDAIFKAIRDVQKEFDCFDNQIMAALALYIRDSNIRLFEGD